MSNIDNLQPSKNRRFWRRVAIAPVCLCLVAGLHAVRVATVNQTPWKGGGFGMFSTVDSEAARFLRVYAVTPDGDLPLVIPERWQKRSWELRAAPTPAIAQELAESLAELPWQHPDPPLVGDLRLEVIPQGKPTDSAVPVWEVRVECWRLVFDHTTKVIRTEKLLAEDSHSFILPIPSAARLNPRLPTPGSRPPTP